MGRIFLKLQRDDTKNRWIVLDKTWLRGITSLGSVTVYLPFALDTDRSLWNEVEAMVNDSDIECASLSMIARDTDYSHIGYSMREEEYEDEDTGRTYMGETDEVSNIEIRVGNYIDYSETRVDILKLLLWGIQQLAWKNNILSEEECLKIDIHFDNDIAIIAYGYKETVRLLETKFVKRRPELDHGHIYN